MKALAICLVLAAGCARKCPRVPAPPPQTVLVKPPPCSLPDLPGPIHPAIGFPTPEEILITKTDFLELVMYVTALTDWIEVAGACLTAEQR